MFFELKQKGTFIFHREKILSSQNFDSCEKGETKNFLKTYPGIYCFQDMHEYCDYEFNELQ